MGMPSRGTGETYQATRQKDSHRLRVDVVAKEGEPAFLTSVFPSGSQEAKKLDAFMAAKDKATMTITVQVTRLENNGEAAVTAVVADDYYG